MRAGPSISPRPAPARMMKYHSLLSESESSLLQTPAIVFAVTVDELFDALFDEHAATRTNGKKITKRESIIEVAPSRAHLSN